MLKNRTRFIIFAFCLVVFAFTTACRYDMQDQPRVKAYKPRILLTSRDIPDGTIARGQLRENQSLYTGKIENATGTAQTNAAGQQITFPDSVTEFPMAVTKEVLDRGQERYKIYCGVCHGAFGGGDGMIVRRGFPKPPSYHDDRLRNAPVGHFFDVATNGWGKMQGYAAQVSVSDRWAIVAYIRALQVSQNPNGAKTATPTNGANTMAPAATPAPATANTNVAAKPANTNSNVKVTAPTNSNTAGGHK